MARSFCAWKLKKGADEWEVAEQVRISPAPKQGGWAGTQLRFLSISRGQSVLTDVERGSLAIAGRRAGLPAMQRMWFHRQGHSLGYNKPRGESHPIQVFFFDAQTRLWCHQRLPAAAIEASAGADTWFIACRNGRVYAFSLEGAPLWSELIPHPRRDNSTNEFWGLPVFHPRLRLAAEDRMLAIGAEQHLHRYQTSGHRLWTEALPLAEVAGDERFSADVSADVPTRAERLATLGLTQEAQREQVQTGYLRFRRDTLLNAGWLKQLQISDFESTSQAEGNSGEATIQAVIDLAFQPGISVLRASLDSVVAGTQDGFVHVFDRDGSLKQTFQVGRTVITDLLVDAAGPRAACCAGRLTLFDGSRISGTAEMTEYYAKLEACGMGVLAWKANEVWLVQPSGRVQLVAEAERAIRGCWGHANGFYVLAGDLASFRIRSQPAPGRASYILPTQQSEADPQR